MAIGPQYVPTATIIVSGRDGCIPVAGKDGCFPIVENTFFAT